MNKKYLLWGAGAVVAFIVLNSLIKKATNSQTSIAAEAGAAVTSGAIGAAADFIAGAAGGVVSSVSPLNNRNILYRGTNTVLGAATGNKDFNLGTWIYDKTH